MKFLSDDFLLSTPSAKSLYEKYAKNMPIIDYHCHINPKEIYENKRFENITQAWLYGDHYKWRLMRWNGVPEKYITGGGSDYDKFLAFARTLPQCIGNPIYHWSHMELKKFFGYEGVLNEDTAEEVWNLTLKKFEPGFTARDFMLESDVKLICTTDDPCDNLEWHKKLSDEGFEVRVLPAMRPDKVLNIELDTFLPYLEKLAEVSGTRVSCIKSLKEALLARLDFFDKMGCKVSDHGLTAVDYSPCSEAEAGDILKRRTAGESISDDNAKAFRTHMLTFLAGEYERRGWVMQLHYGVIRNINPQIFASLGPDTGGDAIGGFTEVVGLAGFLSQLKDENKLPKTILYSINPSDNTALCSIAGCFQEAPLRGKVQHGSAWWFNDTKTGMQEQLQTLANEGVLGSFVGMLTDSRSFLSYPRHDYFRRVLCGFIGKLVDNGEYPNDEKALKQIIEGICFNNAKEYFAF